MNSLAQGPEIPGDAGSQAAGHEAAYIATHLPPSNEVDRTGVVRLTWIAALDKSAANEYASPPF